MFDFVQQSEYGWAPIDGMALLRPSPWGLTAQRRDRPPGHQNRADRWAAQWRPPRAAVPTLDASKISLDVHRRAGPMGTLATPWVG